MTDDRDPKSDNSQPVSDAVVVAADLLDLDFSGLDGRDGSDGVSYAGRQAPQGRDGRSGGDATPAEAGQNGGDIELILRSGPEAVGIVELQGRVALPARGERDCAKRSRSATWVTFT